MDPHKMMMFAMSAALPHRPRRRKEQIVVSFSAEPGQLPDGFHIARTGHRRARGLVVVDGSERSRRACSGADQC